MEANEPVATERTYQAAVKRLTAENKRLQELVDSERRRHHTEVAALAAQLREGLSPELIVLRRELSRWRQRAISAEARLKEKRKGAVQ
jgi:hypothetical protein